MGRSIGIIVIVTAYNKAVGCNFHHNSSELAHPSSMKNFRALIMKQDLLLEPRPQCHACVSLSLQSRIGEMACAKKGSSGSPPKLEHGIRGPRGIVRYSLVNLSVSRSKARADCVSV